MGKLADRQDASECKSTQDERWAWYKGEGLHTVIVAEGYGRGICVCEAWSKEYAQKIAVLPELLEAAELALSHFMADRDGTWDDMVLSLKQAIAKAKGESNVDKGLFRNSKS